MDRRRAGQPGRLQARYEQVAGGPEQRRTYFLVRKHLGFSIAEWDRLPWWHQQVYIEELTSDLVGDHVTDEQASDDELADLGFNVT